jgi:hypothetical protein
LNRRRGFFNCRIADHTLQIVETEQLVSKPASHPFRGALYEGAAAFLGSLLLVGFFWLRADVRGVDLTGSLLIIFGVAFVAGLFFGCAAFMRLRRSRRIRSSQSLNPDNDSLVASCLNSYEDGFEDVTDLSLSGLAAPISVERVLEERTWNVHRAVVFLRTAVECLDAARLKVELARWLRGNFHARWFRGLGLGIVLRSPRLPVNLENVYEIVDGCGGRTVILQWFALVDEGSMRVLAVHMPILGRTTGCFRAILLHLAESGYSIELAIKEKTGVYRKLDAIQSTIPPWLHVLLPLLH